MWSQIEPLRNADELKDFTHAPAFDIQFQSMDLPTPDEEKVDETNDAGSRKKLSVKDEGYQSVVKEIFENLNQAMDEATEYTTNYTK